MSMANDHAKISTDGPKRSTKAITTTPNAHPSINKFKKNGSSNHPNEKISSFQSKNDKPAMATTAPATCTTLTTISPATNSNGRKGVAKMFPRFRDHTSSRNDTEIDCCARLKRSQKMRAPKSTGTKLNVAAPILFK